MDFLKLLLALAAFTQFDQTIPVMSEENMSELVGDCDRNRYNCKNRNICYCDSLCVLYRDCCYDASTNKTATIGNQSISTRYSDCQKTEYDDQAVFAETAAVFMISKCPTSWKEHAVRSRCEVNNNHSNVFDTAPVSSGNGDMVFKNKFCAACHDINDFTLWNIEIKLSPQFSFQNRVPFTENIAKAISHKLSSFRYIPVTKVRKCHYFVLRKENTQNTTSCFDGYLGPLLVITDGNTYLARNRECAKEIIGSSSSIVRFVGCYTLAITQSKISYGGIINLSMLHNRALLHEETACEEMEINLSSKDGCHDLHCPYNFVPFFGVCLNLSILVNDTTGFIHDLLFQANDTVKTDVEFVIPNVKSTLAVLSMNRYTKRIWKSFNGRDSETKGNCTMLRLVIIEGTFSVFNATLRSHFKTLQHKTRSYSFLKDNVLFENIGNIDESTCKIETSLDNPRYILSNFDTLQSHHVPCPAVYVARFDETNESGSTRSRQIVYRIPATRTIIKEEDLVRRDKDYFVCTRTYFLKYARASIGSRCCTWDTCAVNIIIVFLTYFYEL